MDASVRNALLALGYDGSDASLAQFQSSAGLPPSDGSDVATLFALADALGQPGSAPSQPAPSTALAPQPGTLKSARFAFPRWAWYAAGAAAVWYIFLRKPRESA